MLPLRCFFRYLCVKNVFRTFRNGWRKTLSTPFSPQFPLK
jgi:hypothetical protein